MGHFYSASISPAVQNSFCALPHLQTLLTALLCSRRLFSWHNSLFLEEVQAEFDIKKISSGQTVSWMLQKRLLLHKHVTQTRLNEFAWELKIIMKYLLNHAAQSYSTEWKMWKNGRAKKPLELVTEPHSYVHRCKGNPFYCNVFCFLKAGWATARNKLHCVGIASHKIGKTSITVIRKEQSKMTVATHLNLM